MVSLSRDRRYNEVNKSRITIRTRGLPSWLQMHFAVMLLLLMAETLSGFVRRPRLDYSTIDCGNKVHTMVLYPEEGPGPNCSDYEFDFLTESEKQAILDKLNEYRNSIALGRTPPFPEAKNMMEMSWDEELEMIAQRFADQCMFEIDNCNHVSRFKVNQLIGGHVGFILAPEIHVELWFDEITSSTSSVPPRPLSPEDVSVFHQLAWGSTTHFGCARSNYVSLYASLFGYTIRLLVCNYGPGLEVGMSLYEVGTPCSQCSCSTQYPGLCAVGSEINNSTSSMLIPHNSP